MIRRLPAAIVLAGLATAAGAAGWQSTEDSHLTFEATFESDTLPGEFRTFEARLELDPQNTADASLVVTVDLSAADLGDPDMNAVLFDEAWFDVGKFSRATFSSDSISELSPGNYLATGTLDLKGAQRTVQVPFSWEQAGDRAAMRGQVSLTRTDFGVGTGEWATGDSVGLEVKLAFNVTLVATDEAQ